MVDNNGEGNKCFYHLCEKRSKRLRTCKFCSKRLCQEHIKPTKVAVGISAIAEGWKEVGHPCYNYTQYKERKEAQERKEYGKKLNNLLSAPERHNRHQGHSKYQPRRGGVIYHQRKDLVKRLIGWIRRNFIKLLITIAVVWFVINLILLGNYFNFDNPMQSTNFSVTGSAISEGTKGLTDWTNSAISSVTETVDELLEVKPITVETNDIEQAILKYTNEERNSRGLPSLEWDSKLADIAREHSLDMIENNYFAHDNLRGEDPTARAIRNNYNVHKELGDGWFSEGIAENIGSMTTGYVEGYDYVSSDSDSIAKAQVESWMDSPGHRQNILNPNYNRLGVGTTYGWIDPGFGAHYYYISTQDFW